MRRLFVAIVVGVALAPFARANALPEGFARVTVADGLNEPVAVAVAPDGSLFVAQRSGELRLVRAGVTYPEPLLSLDVIAYSESGLLGVALDPDFASNGYGYLFATVDLAEQQILRFRVEDDVVTALDVLRDGIPSANALHNGGGLRVGPDDRLYFSVGDTGDPALASELTSLAGTICRLNLDGTIPDDNPLRTPTGTPRAVWAYGFRNVFRFGFAADGRLFAGDVGSSGDRRFEEINLVTAGGNYGWPAFEGFELRDGAEPVDAVEPMLAYQDPGACIAGVAVYEGRAFPSAYHGNVFHTDYVSNRVFLMELDGQDVIRHAEFCETGRGPVDLVEHDGELLVVEFFEGRVSALVYGTESVLNRSAVTGGNGDPNTGGTGDEAQGGDPGGATGDGANGDGGAAMPCGVGLPVAVAMILPALFAAGLRRRPPVH